MKVMVYCRYVNCHVYADMLPKRCLDKALTTGACYECALSPESETKPLKELLDALH